MKINSKQFTKNLFRLQRFVHFVLKSGWKLLNLMTDFYNLFDNSFKILLLSFVILLSLMWLFLPFAIYGLRNRLDKIVSLLEDFSSMTRENKKKDNTPKNHQSPIFSKEKHPEDTK